MNDLPNRLSRRSTLAVVGAVSAAGLASVGRLAAAGSPPPPASDDALVVDATGNVGVSGALSFGARHGQHLNLWTESNAIGIQFNTQYYRTTGNFAWFKGGTHDDLALNPGAGGTLAMALSVGLLDVKGVVNATKFVGGGAELTGPLTATKFVGGEAELTGPLTITLPSEPLEKEKSLALSISGKHYLQFGAGLPKEPNAGRIGYQVFTQSLDIVGAGEKVDLSDRKITLHTQGGLTVNGPILGGLTVNGPILMDGFLGQYDNSINNAPKAKVEARVKAVLQNAPVGTFMFYLINRGKDPRYAWKDADKNVYSTSVGSSGKDTL